MFAAQGTAEALGQLGNFGSDHAKEPLMLCQFEIQDWPEVQFSRSRVTVVHRGKVVATEYLVELAHICGHILRINRRILDDRDRFCISGDIGQQAESRFSQIPDAILVAAPDHRIMIAKSCLPKLLFKLLGDRSDLLTGLGGEFHGQDGAGISLYKKRFLLCSRFVFVHSRILSSINSHAQGRVTQSHEIRAQCFIDA